jgi:hypothetical protein
MLAQALEELEHTTPANQPVLHQHIREMRAALALIPTEVGVTLNA